MGKKIDPFDYPRGKKQPRYYDIVNIVCFFDVVGFTKNTTNQEMKVIISKIQDDMEELLWEDFNWHELRKRNDLILIPTGDGYGVGFHPSMSNDKVLTVCTDLYKRLIKEGTLFMIRMGLAKGPNIRFLDWNEHVNLFGYGINLASRVLSVAEPNQILVHSDYAEELKQMKGHPELKQLPEPKEIKHGEHIIVYNLYKENEYGIDIRQLV